MRLDLPIRTSQRSAPRKSLTGFQHDGDPIGRLIAKVLREEKPAEGFEDYQALKVAIRRRLKVLRVQYTQAQLDDAISLVDRNTPLVREALSRSACSKSVQTGGELVSPVRAKEILGELVRRTGQQLRSMPTEPSVSAADINEFKRAHVWNR